MSDIHTPKTIDNDKCDNYKCESNSKKDKNLRLSLELSVFGVIIIIFTSIFVMFGSNGKDGFTIITYLTSGILLGIVFILAGTLIFRIREQSILNDNLKNEITKLKQEIKEIKNNINKE